MFSDDFIQYLIDSLELDRSVSEIKDIVNGYFVDEAPKTKPAKSLKKKSKDDEEEDIELPKRKEVSSSKTSKSSVQSSKKVCERVKRGKSEPCGVKATNSIVDEKGVEHWYCGSEKTGCYKCMLGQEKKVKNKKVDKQIIAEKSETKKTVSSVKKPNILDAVAAKQHTVNPKKYQTKTNGIVFLEMEQRILFDPETREAYGCLDDDNDTILPLTKKQLGWLEVHNLPIRDNEVQEKKAPLKKRIMDANDDDTLSELKKELIKKEIGKGNDDDGDDDIDDDIEDDGSEASEEEEYNDVDL